MMHLPSTKRAALACVVGAASVALMASGVSASPAARDDTRLPIRTAAESPGSERAAADRSADKLADRLADQLGAKETAGAYLDATGTLVVTVTDAAAARQVRLAGAAPERVAYSTVQLDRVQDGLDAYAERQGAGKVQGWYVDIPTNTVVVTTLAGADNRVTKAFLVRARSFGHRVDVEKTTAHNDTAALYGGQQVEMSSGFVCSNGFNAQTSAGASVFVTAGHCAEGNVSFSRNGVVLGGTRGYSFPTNDYAAVNINDPAYWAPQAAVDMYDGYARAVSGQSQAPVGSEVCKSGRTTGWTCGTIQAYNQSVNYGGGDIVYGLVQHSACVEQGDSGGSNISGNLAQGVSSGGQLYQSGGSLVCGSKVGQPNVSYYQPIGEALSAYGLTLLTQ